MKVPIAIQYEDLTVHRAYEADFIVRGDIVVEVKATSAVGALDARQLPTYLRFSGWSCRSLAVALRGPHAHTTTA